MITIGIQTKVSLCTVCFVFLLSACSPKNDAALLEKIDRLEKDFASKLENIQARLALLELSGTLSDRESKSGTFDINSKSYSKIDHNNGFFLVSLEDIQPKADGQELTFLFGNPMAASFIGASMKISWQPRTKANRGSPDYLKEFLETTKQAQERQVEITDVLQQGAWSRVTIVIAPATVEKAGVIEISELTTNKLLLKK